jgi:hypothetical protein
MIISHGISFSYSFIGAFTFLYQKKWNNGFQGVVQCTFRTFRLTVAKFSPDSASTRRAICSEMS